jgi:hypothetical protein
MRYAELRAVFNRVFGWPFPLSFVLAGLAVAFLWFTNDQLRASSTDGVVVGHAQPLPDKPHTRGRIP